MATQKDKPNSAKNAKQIKKITRNEKLARALKKNIQLRKENKKKLCQ